ncbi:hypothetical protein AB1K70_24595 [Bremerella sp. JC770]|uniref:hypothetical protein n=1 Tax=Bremerella sp. JC770 TaxID=3232137 RepID=UPI00345ABFB5
MIRPGDVVVYTKTKHTTSPGPRAHDIEPESRGEYYTYAVDKYWIVESVEADGILCRTRRGKSHRISIDDPRLRPASFWEKLFMRGRFPTPV